jgi:signal transduction histidine kinase
VLFNLLGNAVKFTTRGDIEVNLTYVDETLALSVTDTGPGMTAEQLSRLFQPYTQVCTYVDWCAKRGLLIIYGL